jgi:hypothetical protein
MVHLRVSLPLGNQEMPSLVALIVVLVATAASARPAESHEWYAGLRSPSGMPCCNERDCHPVAYRVNRDTGGEEIQANGAWYPVEYGKVLPFPSPDGGYHACWGNAAGRPNFRCILLPGVAFVAPSQGSARITSRFPVQTEERPATHLYLAPVAMISFGIFQPPRTFRWHDLTSRSRRKTWVQMSIGGAGRSQPE